jgi:acetyl esterase/lipase
VGARRDYPILVPGTSVLHVQNYRRAGARVKAKPVVSGVSSDSATVITTGLDVIEETRSFTEQLSERLAAQTPLYEAADPAAAIADARAVGFTGNLRPSLEQARDRVVTSPIGSANVRVLVPEEATGVYLHLHGGGHTLSSAAANDQAVWSSRPAPRWPL